MNKNILKSYMVRYGDTQDSLAKALGLSLSRLNAKINETNAEFRQQEMLFIIKRYKIPAEDIYAIFFNN